MDNKLTRRAALGAGLTLAAGAALGTGGSAAAATNIRVMTWNIHGENADIPAIGRVIKQYGVHITTVQEIHRTLAHDQVLMLARELDLFLGENVHFGPADYPGPCDQEWAGEAGNAVFSRFPIVRRVTKKLSPDDQDCPVKRSLAGTKIDVNGRAMHVFTSHFTPGHGGAATALRHAQATTVANYLTHSGPIVFTGDLNDVEGSFTHSRFIGARFADAGDRHAPGPTLGDARIDYVFTRGITTTGGRVPSPGLSDHRPVIIDMTV